MKKSKRMSKAELLRLIKKHKSVSLKIEESDNPGVVDRVRLLRQGKLIQFAFVYSFKKVKKGDFVTSCYERFADSENPDMKKSVQRMFNYDSDYLSIMAVYAKGKKIWQKIT